MIMTIPATAIKAKTVEHLSTNFSLNLTLSWCNQLLVDLGFLVCVLYSLLGL